ncbi:hypothetical protein [Planktotalea arctica]|uniref:hypothetical protein n=2 Tax=Planktotalea arctica TaxID=1481893 RepID=UPI00321BBCC8
MRTSRIALSTAIALALSGCMPSNEPMFSSRGAVSSEITKSNASSEILMAEQTNALTQMTRDIIRKSTLSGAAIGAIAGCGMAVLSAGNAKSCVTAALSGGAVGAVAGNIKGRQHAAKRVALVSPSALVRSIGKADDHMDAVTRDLPELLKQQDAELATLNSQVSAGQITEAQFTQRFEVIKANRQQLAEALSLSAAQAEEAHTNLENARSKGQTGLEWHLSATQNLAREATSARSAISLL